MTIDEIQTTTEFQQFDRKSVRIDAKSLAVVLVAMANADGGVVAIGVEDDGTLTGIDNHKEHLNELLRVPFDYCVPSVQVAPEFVEVTDADGLPNHIVLLHIQQSMQVHATTADDVFYRVGDKSKKLSFEQRMQLVYAKGEHYYEDAPVNNSTIADIDMQVLEDYLRQIGYNKGPEAYIRENDLLVRKEEYHGRSYEVLTGAAVLLFAANPQRFFQRARVRVIRYEGTEEKFGTEMNVIKDEIFDGGILEMTNQALAFVKTQIKEHTYLGQDGRFVTVPQYPEFCWMELIVNAIAHRDYSILGTDIQVKVFDDHLTVESPGVLPGLVRPNNIRQMHFSRNPKIAQYMHAYKLVKEFGEGVDRMFREMAEVGNPAPVYQQVGFMVKATIRQHAETIFGELNGQLNKELNIGETNNYADGDNNGQLNGELNGELNNAQKTTLDFIKDNPGCRAFEISKTMNIPYSTIDKHIRVLLRLGLIERRGSKKTGGYYIK